MDRLFIDANIWLAFFDGRLSKFQELLKSLEALKGHIFVPKQIVDEIERNKAGVYLRSVAAKDVETKFGQNMPPLSPALEEWNARLETLKANHKTLKSDREAIVLDHVKQICEGADSVSLGFGRVFTEVSTATDDQLSRARLRKELGNPPGKTEDPLGDQLCWEQLLESLQRGDRLWLVTNDKDYFTAFKGELFLNPALKNDVTAKLGAEFEVYYFNDLPAALKHFNANKVEEGDFDIPSDEELDEIEKEYRTALADDERLAMAAALMGRSPFGVSNDFPLGGSRGWNWGCTPGDTPRKSLVHLLKNPDSFAQSLGNGGIIPKTCSRCGSSMEHTKWVPIMDSDANGHVALCEACGWSTSTETPLD